MNSAQNPRIERLKKQVKKLKLELEKERDSANKYHYMYFKAEKEATKLKKEIERVTSVTFPNFIDKFKEFYKIGDK